MPTAQSERDKSTAKAVFDSLPDAERWLLGDDLVLGTFDWTDYLDKKPSREFMEELERLRLHWEMTR